MNLRDIDLSRRRFLTGVGGACVGLPLLDVMSTAHGAGRTATCSAIMINSNGIQQALDSEAERFWPRTPGPLSTKILGEENADRAVAELAAYGDQLLMLRGMRTPFSHGTCGHTQGGVQVLTAAQWTRSSDSKAMGESVDNFIVRQLGGKQSLLLYAGQKGVARTHNISFRGPMDARVGEGQPLVAYMKVVGLGAVTTPEMVQQITSRRASVNDFTRGELKQLLARTDLSMADRRRLDMHFSAIRQIEIDIVKELDPARVSEMKAVGTSFNANEKRLEVVRLHMDIMALAMASGRTPVTVLQSGASFDDMTYTVDGVKLSNFHGISHRASGGGGDGSSPGDQLLHHQIDRIHARDFKYLLDRMASHQTPDGTLLDTGFAVWTNQMATGAHTHHNHPFLIAGKARGFFKTGRFLNVSNNTGTRDQGNIDNNQLLNVFIAAMGIRKPGGALVDDFGDPSLKKGLLMEAVA